MGSKTDQLGPNHLSEDGDDYGIMKVRRCEEKIPVCKGVNLCSFTNQ